MSRIAVVVLTWNNCPYTLDCLRSLAHQRMPHTLYVVDNASTDETVAAVGAAVPEARILANRENLGFAAGNNVGLERAFAEGAEAVLVLNNDTTLEADALRELVQAAEAHGDAGILSPLILFSRAPNRVWFAGATVSGWTGQDRHLEYDRMFGTAHLGIRQIERAAGCAMFITRACFRRIGGFDESLFMYFEDVEYSLRSREAGFRVLLVPSAIIYHQVSISTGGAKSADGIYYMLRNGIAVIERYYPVPPPGAAARRAIMLLAMVRFIFMTPRAGRRIRDVLAGFRDARRRRLGRRRAPLPTPVRSR